ncbi:MAG: type II secretion system protein GspD [Opitutales bacterium]
MQTKLALYSLLFVPLALFAQDEAVEAAAEEISVIEDSDASTSTAPAAEEEQPVTVIEIPDEEVEGASMDSETEEIPVLEETPLDESEVVFEMPVENTGDTSSGEATMESEETISVDFPDEDVRTILRNVADLFELNLVIPDTLQGRTSLKLKNITWKQVFEVVLEPLGFTYVEDRNIVRIKSLDDMTTEPVETTVEIIKHADAGQVRQAVNPLVDAAAGGNIQVDARSNALIITERPSKMGKIREIIDLLDEPTSQVMIETKFVEVNNDDVKDIGVDWASLSGYEMGAGPFQREYSRGREKTNESTGNSSAASGTQTDTDSGSINGNTSAVPRTVTTTENVSTAAEALSELSSIASTSRLDTAVFNAAQFRLVLSALKTINDSKLVAHPTVVTMNNQKARIDIIREVPQIEFTFNPETGTREAQGLADPLSFGTSIEVTPQVNDGGFINLNVTPEVSNQVGEQETLLGPQPIIDVRKAQTQVVIKDGFTLAIGGLSQNEETNSGSRVPLLGDLPGVGKLFRSNSDSVTQRNLIIFITAKILNPDGSDYRDVVDPRVLDDMKIVPSELPGYEIPEEERALLRRLEEIRSEKTWSERSAQLNAQIQELEPSPDTAEADAE